MMRFNKFTIYVLAMITVSNAMANEVKILASEFINSGNNQWSVNVTLKHDDTGWEHYADNWRVVDSAGNVLGNRVLYHPHVDEQPFTRGLNIVMIPQEVKIIYVESHDKVHGWSTSRLKVDLSKVVDGRLIVKSE